MFTGQNYPKYMIVCFKITHDLIICHWIVFRHRIFDKSHLEYGKRNTLLPTKEVQASANIWINIFEAKVTSEEYFPK